MSDTSDLSRFIQLLDEMGARYEKHTYASGDVDVRFEEGFTDCTFVFDSSGKFARQSISCSQFHEYEDD